ncbi:hypothetical protein [Streptomyces sp. NPDC059009]|uniref:hypothetical protein n=1 Tax=Streptomyces sp. NPDC059009 TaxID=3346694 RepID=UPI0036B81B42
MSHVQDEVLRGFWTWYEQLSDQARAVVTAPLMNKVRALLLRPFVRDTLTGGSSTIDMDSVLDGGICLVRLSQDTLGAETAAFVGSLVVARTWQSAIHRDRLPQSERRDCALYIDECHHFLHLPYALTDMLAAARGYRLSLTLSHQYLRQLPRELEAGVSANARTKVFLNASPEDARSLAWHTAPRLTEYDLTHLPAFHAAIRPVVHGRETPAFTIRTEQLPPPVAGRDVAIRQAAASALRPSVQSPLAHPASRPAADPRRTA